jgi:hypothetical protein
MTDMIDAEKDYASFLPDAQAMPAADVLLPYQLNVDLAINNVTRGYQVIVAHKDDIPLHLPKEDLSALLTLPQLALATKFAALKAEQLGPTGIKEKLAEASRRRRRLLKVAQGLVEMGLIPTGELQEIAAGSGNRDIAEDCVSLPRLFRKYEKEIAGKHAVDAAEIDETAALGGYLVSVLRAKGAKPFKAATSAQEIDIRNRMATLLVKRYERLRAVAYYFHESDWEQRAPALRSHRGKHAPKAEAQATQKTERAKKKAQKSA